MERKYKDSGIEWIGKIPETWNLKRLVSQLIEIKEKNNPLKTDKVLSLTIKDGVIPYEEKGDVGNKSKENHEEYKLAYPNTIVLNSMNILIGAVGISNYYGCVSPVYYVFKNRDSSNLRFINYIMSSTPFQKYLRKYANGILEIRLRISAEDILKRQIPSPDLNVQQRISDYLDKKCGEIDSLIALQEQMIEILKAYKQSVITEAVTKGLNPNAKLVPSGIDWIGDIPEGWQTKPFKELFRTGKGLSFTKADLVKDGIPVISYGQVHSKQNKGTRIDKVLVRFVPEEIAKSGESSKVNVGDFIFADTSEDLSGCGNCVYVDREIGLYAGYHSVIAFSKRKKSNTYLAYLFLTDCWRSQIRCRVSGIKVFSISQAIIKQTSIILPSENEQEAIANYLDEKCADIDRLIALKQQKIESLKDYKKSVIYEAVTGKTTIE